MAERKETAPPPPSLGAAAAGDMVTIEVGPNHQNYQVYKDFLVYYSDYFRKALAGPWKEAEGVVRIEDVEPELFKLFIYWLYTQDVKRLYSEDVDVRECFKLSYGTAASRMMFMKLYVFADRFSVPKLRKAVNNHYVTSGARFTPWYDVVIYAFDNLPSAYKILDFLVDTQCANWSDKDSPEETELKAKLPHDFLVRVMSRSRELLRGGKSKKIIPCEYHEHDSEEEKKACGQEGK
ncbi:hypothetical protein K491DRAFT_715065 [Lophiostoma macrostomum CBS 122681]|uniref:BTB domain-containing protein n=1 Tax=Lophiostoma macrostomum CBS 122681 TaxID=1314788 RepID=A0A6A6TA63_9PLEO|nr:hypothetical protein K491DRAFT_715065 [Lophiostoma macrostomum CBS 122681]